MQHQTRPDLLSLFKAVPDPRHRRGIRQVLPVILAVGLAAVLPGARSFAAIGEWVADQSGESVAALGASAGSRPTESTIRRAFAHVDADLLNRALGRALLWTRTRVSDTDYQSGRLAVVVTFDEGAGENQNIPFVIVHRSLSGDVISAPYTYYGLARLYTDVLGVAPVGAGSTEPGLKRVFGL